MSTRLAGGRRPRVVVSLIVLVVVAIASMIAMELSTRVEPLISVRRWFVERVELSTLGSVAAPEQPFSRSLELPRLVAHGGGAVRGLAASNSVDALDHNYAEGFRFFEIDLEWTSDGEVVLAHDWDAWTKRYFDEEPGRLSAAEFHSANMTNGLRQLDLAGCAEWMRAHADAVVITDFKKDNIRGLERIRDRYPDLVNRIVPQVYRFSEFDEAAALGFESIILTLYRKNYSNWALHAFLERRRPLAVTMPATRASASSAVELELNSTFVFAHTVNVEREALGLYRNGVDGFYTDSLSPDFSAAFVASRE